MNASPEHQRILLDVADLDRRLQQAEHRRSTPPQGPRINELAKARQEQLRDLTVLTGTRDDIRTELTRLESDVRVTEQRRTRDTDRLAAATNPKDAQALEHELASLTRRVSDLEDTQLGVMARLEEAEAAVAAQQALIDTTTAEGTELTAQAKAQVAAAATEIEQLTRDREAIAAEIPADLLAEYTRRASRGIGVGLLRRGTCEGCRMMLSGTHLNEIRRAAADDVVSCPECGAILVRTDESGL
ncbi:zinc ribbon domain-containing protein [Microbacterium paludicola]|uniref:zinc ribbon domain-containing protein n=1 Tax=Microbacterium paludicola TaxID=300019 RepID=UPI0011A14984|nr:C4-type zinc ribbon domain-containing protein [Microbacterium paludicola]